MVYRVVLVVAIVVGGLVWATADNSSPERGNEMAARYHLRSRTQRFFKRSAPKPLPVRPTEGHEKRILRVKPAPDAQNLAARYHLRTRTQRFFARAVA
ncbi:MAG: hypothetical protein ACYC6N_23480 [Pirellulaceae bacterium]